VCFAACPSLLLACLFALLRAALRCFLKRFKTAEEKQAATENCITA
jgi:hypothetical protein